MLGKLRLLVYKLYRDNPPPEIEKPLRSNNLSDVTTPWYSEFVNLDQEILFELILAANYLDIKSLLELSCAKVASSIKSRSIPEIRKYLNIENDFTPEEEAQIMEENKWAEESFWWMCLWWLLYGLLIRWYLVKVYYK